MGNRKHQERKKDSSLIERVLSCLEPKRCPSSNIISDIVVSTTELHLTKLVHGADNTILASIDRFVHKGNFIVPRKTIEVLLQTAKILNYSSRINHNSHLLLFCVQNYSEDFAFFSELRLSLEIFAREIASLSLSERPSISYLYSLSPFWKSLDVFITFLEGQI